MSRLRACPRCRALLEPGTGKCPYCGVAEPTARPRGEEARERDIEATHALSLWILAVCLFFYAWAAVSDPEAEPGRPAWLHGPSASAMVAFGANAHDLVIGCRQPWRLASSAFLHFDLLHLGLNAFALTVVVPLSARAFGAARTGAIYLLSALGGSAASCWALGEQGISAGASGAVCGL
ncbi:MAG: rhomboid family intramembrane serine protease, partial [Planctomycetota bacterium]